jgi:MFS family permease
MADELEPTMTRPVPLWGTRWLTRNVAAIVSLSLFSDMSHEMVTAVLPLYILSIGGTAAAVGLVDGLSDFAASLAKLGMSWYSDRIGRRKPIMAVGYWITALKGLMGFATTIPAVVAIRSIAWLARGARGPVHDALLAESVVPQYRGRAFGLSSAMDTIGAVLGPAIASGLLALHFSYRNVFFVSLIPGAIVILIVTAVVQDHRRAARRGPGFRQSLAALPRDFDRYLLAVGVFGLGNFGHTLLILRAQQLLTPQYGLAHASALAIGLYTLFNAVYALGAFPAALWAERIGKRTVLGVAYALFALMCIGFEWVDGHLTALAGLFALGGLYIAFVDAMEAALAADLVPAEVLGTGYGLLGAVNGAGDLLSSLIVGWLLATVSITSGFTYAIALTALGAVLLFTLRPAAPPSLTAQGPEPSAP